jgi:hypothetical protein
VTRDGRPSFPWLVALTVALVAACKTREKENCAPCEPAGAAPAGQTPSTPMAPAVERLPTLVWNGGPDASFQYNDSGNQLDLVEIGATAHFSFWTEGKYAVRFRRLPAGTKVTLGRDTATVREIGNVEVKLDVWSWLADVDPRDLWSDHQLDPGASVELVYPGGLAQKIELPPVGIIPAMDRILKTVADHPLLFANEPGAPPAEHTILWIETWAKDSAVIGPARVMRDVDWIAFATALPARRSAKTCSAYMDAHGGPGKQAYPFVMVDDDVAIYERTTSKVIARTTFAAPEQCPQLFRKFYGDDYIGITSRTSDTVMSTPAREPIKEWLRAQRAR